MIEQIKNKQTISSKNSKVVRCGQNVFGFEWKSSKNRIHRFYQILKVSNFKMSFWCQNFFQKTNEIFSRISALASKKRSNQKNKGTLYQDYFIPLIGGFYFDFLTLLFLFDLFLQARAEIQNYFRLFLVQMKTLKSHFEIN